MAALMLASAGLSMASSFMASRAAKKAADKARKAEMQGAKMQYAYSKNATYIMKAANREATANAVQESLRAGAENNREVKEDIQTASSKMLASSEGLTSGRSQGRQMIALQIEGNKFIQESQNETTSMINKLVDNKDKANNDLNMKLLLDYQQMATVLTTPGAVYQSNPMDILNAGISGAASGASLANALG